MKTKEKWTARVHFLIYQQSVCEELQLKQCVQMQFRGRPMALMRVSILVKRSDDSPNCLAIVSTMRLYSDESVTVYNGIDDSLTHSLSR